MKKKIFTYIVYLSIVAIGLNFIEATSKKNDNQDKFLKENNLEKGKPLVSTITKPIKIPEKVEFAGETLDLGRYDLREKYDREINGFSYLHSTVMLYIKRANRYFPIIEPILKEYGIPDDFKYLAVIESQLEPRAISPAKAAGLWQFMPSTAKEYGLEVNSEVDERFHIEKATMAACKYFNKSYDKYKDWASVALAYNGGQGRISTELSKQYADNGLDLWLVEETSRYYFRMVAIKQIFENPSKYGFVIEEDQLYKPLKYTTVEVDSTIPDLAKFAKDNGVTYAQLKDFNSWLRDRKLTVLKNKYNIKIPDINSMDYNKSPVEAHNKRWVVK